MKVVSLIGDDSMSPVWFSMHWMWSQPFISPFLDVRASASYSLKMTNLWGMYSYTIEHQIFANNLGKVECKMRTEPPKTSAMITGRLTVNLQLKRILLRRLFDWFYSFCCIVLCHNLSKVFKIFNAIFLKMYLLSRDSLILWVIAVMISAVDRPDRNWYCLSLKRLFLFWWSTTQNFLMTLRKVIGLYDEGLTAHQHSCKPDIHLTTDLGRISPTSSC